MAGFNELANRVLQAELNSFWQGLAIAAAVGLLMRIARGLNAATRHAVWWLVLASVLVMPWLMTTRRNVSGPQQARTQATPVVRQAAVESLRHTPRTVQAGNTPAVVMATWSVISLLMLLRLAWSFQRLRRLLRRCAPAPVAAGLRFAKWRGKLPGELLVSGEVASPMASGFLRPVVVLPEALLLEISEAELDHVLVHEIAHIARRDQWTNLLARLAEALLVLHPVAWWVLRNIERERELSCDEWVVAATGDARPYAATLARMFDLCRLRRRELMATGMADRASSPGGRIEMLLDGRLSAKPGTSVWRVMGCVVALVGCVMTGATVPAWIAFAQNTPARVSVRPAKRASLLAALVAGGYGSISVDEIIGLKTHGVGPDYIRGATESGWGKLSAPDLIALHDRGVPPEYLQGVREAGFENPAVRDAIELKAHGVDPTQIREIHGLGFGPFEPRQAIELQTNGVGAELFRAFKEFGFTGVTVAEAVEAKNVGLRPESLREARQYGSGLTPKQVIRLKQAGVI